MKKFTKRMLIAAGIFGAAGIGLTVAGGVMGANMAQLDGFESIGGMFWSENTVSESEPLDDTDDIEEADDQEDVEFMNAKSESTADCVVYQLQHQPVKLDIELKYDELDLEEGDSFSVKVYNDKGNNVTIKESADTLKIRSTKRAQSRKVCVCYPKDVKLSELDIEMGAGSVYLNREIQVDRLKVEVGTGEFEGNASVTTKEADLQIGTGSMTFTDLSAEKTSGECGLGGLDLTMTGDEKDYNYDLQCGIGNMDVGSDSYSGFGKEDHISNTGADRKMDLECGMENVAVSFSGKEHRG